MTPLAISNGQVEAVVKLMLGQRRHGFTREWHDVKSLNCSLYPAWRSGIDSLVLKRGREKVENKAKP